MVCLVKPHSIQLPQHGVARRVLDVAVAGPGTAHKVCCAGRLHASLGVQNALLEPLATRHLDPKGSWEQSDTARIFCFTQHPILLELSASQNCWDLSQTQPWSAAGLGWLVRCVTSQEPENGRTSPAWTPKGCKTMPPNL